MTNSHKYRPDIDGLRALAVLAVLFFHAKIGCPGGYVGVDIFFVISGFLITSLILEEIQAGTFTLAGFWERRIRRIAPALTCVVLVTIVAGWCIFWPDDYRRLGNSVISQAVLLANIYFSRTRDYFNPGVQTMPLLHTWSLAVEEQFYVLFPLLLIFLTRSKRFPLVGTIKGLCLGSFILSVVAVYVAPQPTYYLLPTRACELLAGALLASHPWRPMSNSRWNELAGFLGLGLICWPVFGYSTETRFPGAAAVPPCVGAALVIYSSSGKSSLAGRFLAWQPLVFIGLISYSLYLWHWPLLMFANYVAEVPLDGIHRLALLGVSVILAIFSWKFIETPFRKRTFLTGRARLFALAGCSQLALLLLGAGIHFDRGRIARMPAKAAYYYSFQDHSAFCNEITPAMAVAGQFAELGSQNTHQPVEILLWGDSHAMAVAPVLDELCRRYSVRGMEATHSTTAPILGYAKEGSLTAMADAGLFAQAVAHFVTQQHVKIVIIAARWSLYDPIDLVTARLAATIQTLRAAGARVYVLQDVPFAGFNVPNIAAQTVYKKEDAAKLNVPLDKYSAENRACEPIYNQARQAGAVVLEPARYLLNPRGYYEVIRNDKLLYRDDSHLTVEGALALAPMFEPLFKSVREFKSGS